MRLEFNVLWVEDQQDQVIAQKERISTLLRKEGFRFQVQFANSVEQASSFLSDDVYGDHIDLVLMDYDLGTGKRGDEGLEIVRQEFPYKDIVFYSGQRTADLAQMVSDKHVQGVFVCHRPELPDTVHGVFENLVRKVLDIDHARGIVMGATSDIDNVIVGLLQKRFDDSHGEEQAALLSEIPKRLDQKKKAFGENLETILQAQHPNDLLSHHSVFTSDDRLRLLGKLLKITGKDTEKLKSFTDYRENVVPKRNDLAHVTVKVEGFSRKLIDRKGIEFTSEQMNALRLKLLEFQEKLSEL
ncbi:response regulator [Leisingera sp. SS27]|uniref:response regulator n=1 Tax=Leisingera sp. SS27 TaxID=2979462 RepID=UPI00232E0A68|nr:response regulator [Leisingera sp. SS27]MDC0657412.1 response regulator [Leisingera sp. SS27]